MKKLLACFLALTTMFMTACNKASKDALYYVFNDSGKYGFINQSGKQVIDFKFDSGRPFNEGLAAVSKDGKYGYIDSTGKVVIDYQFKEAYDFSDGLACVANDNGVYGYIDKKGDVVIDYQFNSKSNFSEGYALVRGNNNLYGFINKIGELKVDFKYTGALSFSDGYACVWKGSQDGNVIYSYIDYNGVEKIQLDEKVTKATSFNNGKALVQEDEKSWYFIDNGGNKQDSIEGEYKDITPYKCGLAAVETGDKWGYIDEAGKLVIPCEYSYAVTFTNDMAFVSRTRGNTMTAAVINKKGKAIYEYKEITTK